MSLHSFAIPLTAIPAVSVGGSPLVVKVGISVPRLTAVREGPVPQSKVRLSAVGEGYRIPGSPPLAQVCLFRSDRLYFDQMNDFLLLKHGNYSSGHRIKYFLSGPEIRPREAILFWNPFQLGEGLGCRYKALQANDCKPNDCKP